MEIYQYIAKGTPIKPVASFRPPPGDYNLLSQGVGASIVQRGRPRADKMKKVHWRVITESNGHSEPLQVRHIGDIFTDKDEQGHFIWKLSQEMIRKDNK